MQIQDQHFMRVISLLKSVHIISQRMYTKSDKSAVSAGIYAGTKIQLWSGEGEGDV